MIGLVLAEAMLVAVTGGVVGALGIAYAVFSSGQVADPRRGLRVHHRSIGGTCGRRCSPIPLGALAGAQPAWSAVRMTITEALRYSE